ncbi:ROK family protein [Herbiconiux sp. CPCC 203386]|uniref:ROK family protein n=1 Tax=Herbiconiux daphne TaxID=2970914 RepID=A0ABT2GY09_9MICO|nr:ROK family protein [Herbiconiux daphne]
MTEPPIFGSASTATTNDQTRRTNLSLILSLVHHRGSLTRAELARVTGLNRSTVATLTGQLGELELLYETSPGTSTTVGRPSSHVHANPATAALAVNPEIDAITIGLVGLGGRVIKRIRYPTQRIPSAQEATNIAAAVIDGMRGELDSVYRIVGVGVAVPGLVRAEDGLVTYAPHLGWNDEPIARMIADATGYPVWAANDASLGAGGELLFGAGRGSIDLLYLNGGSSGIGGGVVTGGQLLTGTDGYAGELGHTLVNSAGVRCHCGAIGCLETEVSRQRLLDAAGLDVVGLDGVGLDGGDGDELEAALAESRDPAVGAEVDRQIGFLSVALRNAVNVLNPERIVLGGFLATLHSLAPERLAQAVRADALDGPAHDVHISAAGLGSNLLMIGAAELAFSGLLADPARVAAKPSGLLASDA